MTPLQFHYPFFFELAQLNVELKPLQWEAQIAIADSQDGEEHLSIKKLSDLENLSGAQPGIKIGFHETLMVQHRNLFCWRKYTDGLFIRQFQLDTEDINSSMLSEFIPIETLKIGRQVHETKLDYEHLVTFMRKENLEIKEEFYEKYVIIILHQQEITIIPFDSFNETGGDPLYMWPALASLDTQTGKLHGVGMRMGFFTVSIEKELLG